MKQNPQYADPEKPCLILRPDCLLLALFTDSKCLRQLILNSSEPQAEEIYKQCRDQQIYDQFTADCPEKCITAQQQAYAPQFLRKDQIQPHAQRQQDQHIFYGKVR